MLKLIAAFLFFFINAKALFAQITINGPTCVNAGTEYQYNLGGDWTTGSVTQVCIAGGIIATTSTSCYTDSVVNYVRVIWNSSGSNGIISVTSGDADVTAEVTITPVLNGGNVDSSVKYQYLDSSGMPATITCAVATGGACSPAYSYQWEVSTDNVNWSDIDGATNENLEFSSPLIQTSYFRRKTMEVNSQSIVYSDVALAEVNMPIMENLTE